MEPLTLMAAVSSAVISAAVRVVAVVLDALHGWVSDFVSH